MRKKIILWLFSVAISLLTLYSCIHDEVSMGTNPETKEYASKSPWKEDEKYIKNVKQIFEQYGDETYFASNFGTIYWDYAVTMGTNETFLEVPVIKNNKVNFVLLVYKDGDRVFFKRKEEENSEQFFNALVFNNRTELKGSTISGVNNDPQAKGGCVSITTTWTWTNDDGSAGPTYVFTEMHCLPSGPALPCQSIEIDGNCGGTTGGGGTSGSGGGSGGGNGYPYPQQTSDACAKIKQNQYRPKYYQKYNELNKQEIFDMDKERGFYELQPPTGVNVESGFVQIDGPPGSTGLDLPDNTDRISGLFHSHNNKQGSVKIFSPTDVKTFINIFLKNANQYAGSYADAYSTVVTSAGSYTLKYTKDNHPGGINYDTSQIWKAWYYDKMEEIQEKNGGFPQNEVEQVFTQFLSEVVNIDGLEVYKVTASTSAKISYDSNTKQVNITPCP